jgi:hypothetical protein
MPKVRFASKNGAFRKLWITINDSGSSTATVSTAITIQRKVAPRPRHPPSGRVGTLPAPFVDRTPGTSFVL